MLIHQKYSIDDELWASLALKDSNHSEDLNLWKQLASVRLVCALLAWTIVCVLMWSDYSVSLKLIDLSVRLRQMIVRRKNRISEMEGDGDILASLPETKLRTLIEMQRVILIKQYITT